jgi:hypothetical protein
MANRPRSAARRRRIVLGFGRIGEGHVPKRQLGVDEIMAILPETPRRIAGATAGLPASRLRDAPEPGAWSVNDVLAHLRACHDVLGGSILRIVTEDHPAWKGINPRVWIKRTDYPDWEFAPAFEAFTTQRRELLGVLEPLPAGDWERTATVTGMVGDHYERTARYYGDWLARHERGHWRHIYAIVAALGD